MVSAAARLRAMAEAAPSRHLPWLPLQLAFLDDPSMSKLIRAGNQYFGKTAALCEEMRRRGECDHPAGLRYPRRMICVSPSAPQSVSIQKKLWECLDKRLLDERTHFDPVIGFRGRYPAVRWRNGTVLLFKSGEAGAISFAGETLDDIFIDEPTTLRIYQEADRRVKMRGGYVIMGMTPINAKEPLDWLRELCARGVISEHHAALEPEQMIPVGHDEPRRDATGTPIDAAYIERERDRVLGHMASIILDGEWETPPVGQVFAAFDPRPNGQHVTRRPPEGDLDLWIGIDHGERDHKQCAVLVGIRDAGEQPEVWILDEWAGDGRQTPDDVAAGIIEMLSRWSVTWQQLAGAYGDKPHMIGGWRAVDSISNAEIEIALRRRIGLRRAGALKPEIYQAKRGVGGGRGSVDRGCTWLHRAMVSEGKFFVMQHCERVIESLHRWSGKDDEWKDIIDALRYATWGHAMSFPRSRSAAPQLRAP